MAKGLYCMFNIGLCISNLEILVGRIWYPVRIKISLSYKIFMNTLKQYSVIIYKRKGRQGKTSSVYKWNFSRLLWIILVEDYISKRLCWAGYFIKGKFIQLHFEGFLAAVFSMKQWKPCVFLVYIIRKEDSSTKQYGLRNLHYQGYLWNGLDVHPTFIAENAVRKNNLIYMHAQQF